MRVTRTAAPPWWLLHELLGQGSTKEPSLWRKKKRKRPLGWEHFSHPLTSTTGIQPSPQIARDLRTLVLSWKGSPGHVIQAPG